MALVGRGDAGLDARSLLNGQFRVFFPSAMGKEPLYIYLTTPFVAAWDGQPFAVRLAGALLGALMVPALYAAGRALWPARPTIGLWSGVIAAGLWTVNFWPQSINRIGFQVNPFPLILTLAVIGWLNYTRRPTRRRAIFFGLMAGLTLTTYLAGRITPLLWVLLYVALPRPKRQALRPTLLWALLIGCLIAAPLAIHFALNPGDFFQRVGGFDTLRTDAQQVTVEKFRWSVQQLLGGFVGFYGDSILRHNLPNRPPFSPVAGALFAVGAILALVTIVRRRDQGATHAAAVVARAMHPVRGVGDERAALPAAARRAAAGAAARGAPRRLVGGTAPTHGQAAAGSSRSAACWRCG